MSSRDAFCPLLAAAKFFSHDFNSSLREFDFSVNSVFSASCIFLNSWNEKMPHSPLEGRRVAERVQIGGIRVEAESGYDVKIMAY